MSVPKKSLYLRISKIYASVFSAIAEKPALFMPFLVFALLEVVVLGASYIVPRQPFVTVFGPIVRTLWGEKFLHYPAHFLLIPKLMYNARMVLAVVFGSLLSGIAVSMFYKKTFDTLFKKYFALFLVVLLNVGIFWGFSKVLAWGLIRYFMTGRTRLLFMKAGIWLGPMLPIIGFFVSLFIQSFFVYAIPIIIKKDEKVFKAIINSFAFFKKNILVTLILLGLPMLIYVPMIVLSYNTAFLMYTLFPEVVLLLSIVNIGITSLVIDPLVTLSTAYLYKEQNAQ